MARKILSTVLNKCGVPHFWAPPTCHHSQQQQQAEYHHCSAHLACSLQEQVAFVSERDLVMVEDKVSRLQEMEGPSSPLVFSTRSEPFFPSHTRRSSIPQLAVNGTVGHHRFLRLLLSPAHAITKHHGSVAAPRRGRAHGHG